MAKQVKVERQTLNVAEAAELAGLGQKAIRKGVADGSIPAIPRSITRNVLIPRAAFLRWLEALAGEER